ncbi:MAG: sugar ABC transporter ATP-binding protein [Chloroflexi bacterium]|nr:sugar ABC transporter ATP-binding protein [Chloroflexota bacterium]
MNNSHFKLSMQNIVKEFPGVKALDKVNFEIEQGKIMALIGANGAGKSTLMNILGGIHQQDTGEILINGKIITIKDPLDASKKGIAFVHQELTALSKLRIMDNMLINDYPTKLGLIDDSEAKVICKKILKRIGSDLAPEDLMEDIGPGDQQMIEIARALVHKPKLILFDEPTSSLSKKEKDNLFKVIKKLREDGVAVVYITHLLDEIYGLCDEVMVMRNGRVVSSGLIDEFPKDRIICDLSGEDGRKKNVTKKSFIVKDDVVLVVEDLNRSGILHDINLSLNKGEVLGIWGLMGSGRTELVRALVGLDPIESGTIYSICDGHKKQIAPHDLRQLVGLVTEDRRNEGLFQPMTVAINLSIANLKAFLGKSGVFIDRKKEKNEVEKTIKKLNIVVSSQSQQVRTLSGGNQQKVILGRWLQRNPELFFLDEPIKGIDVNAKAEVKNIIHELTISGKSILIISSEIEELLGFCDRYLVMNRGSITAEFPHTATKEQLMEASLSAREKGIMQ